MGHPSRSCCPGRTDLRLASTATAVGRLRHEGVDDVAGVHPVGGVARRHARRVRGVAPRVVEDHRDRPVGGGDVGDPLVAGRTVSERDRGSSASWSRPVASRSGRRPWTDRWSAPRPDDVDAVVVGGDRRVAEEPGEREPASAGEWPVAAVHRSGRTGELVRVEQLDRCRRGSAAPKETPPSVDVEQPDVGASGWTSSTGRSGNVRYTARRADREVGERSRAVLHAGVTRIGLEKSRPRSVRAGERVRRWSGRKPCTATRPRRRCRSASPSVWSAVRLILSWNSPVLELTGRGPALHQDGPIVVGAVVRVPGHVDAAVDRLLRLKQMNA